MTTKLSDATLAALQHAAGAAYKMAYAPYSKFKVGAAVLADDGKIYTGCNMENAAYPEGLCAEAGALAAMVLAGAHRARAVMVVGAGLCTPCGGCRQKLREFCKTPEELQVFIASPQELQANYSLAELLPQSFGPQHLDAE